MEGHLHHHHHHHHLHHHHDENQLNQDHELARRVAHAHSQFDLPPNVELPSPAINPDYLKLVARADSATSTCTDHTQPGCELPTSVSINTGAIIGVTVAIPVFVALVVLYLLHRRNLKRQAAEDVADAQKDLDYGLDTNASAHATGRGKKGATATVSGFEKNLRRPGGHVTGVSIDLGNPYMLPPEMNGSRASLHSLTRSLTDKQDPYSMVSQQTPSLRNFGGDAHSIRSASDRALISNAAPTPLSRSASPLVPFSDHHDALPIQRKEVAAPQSSVERVEMPTFDFTDHTADARPESTSYISEKSVDISAAKRVSDPNKSLPATPHEADQHQPAHPPRGSSLERKPTNATNNAGPVDPFAFQEVVVPPSPEAESHEDTQRSRASQTVEHYDASTFPHAPPPEPTNNRATLGLGFDMSAGNRLSILRPLPPDDPYDNPETRANRIRSFYKEYFADGDAHVHDASGLDYYEDYGDEYLQDGAVFDPETGQFIVAQGRYADPITRRAMTPPPRGPPARFQSGPRRPGHASQGSSPGLGGPRSRAFSNASTSRMGGPRGRQGKRPLPPPMALRNLPTPHLLKEDAFNLTMDFAPPQSYRDRVAGRSESPFMDERPYGHDTPIAQSPLASSHTELAAVPSPHLLRKSGTFTALDFAPPPRFRDMDGGGSDAGSIRSGRSNFSAVSARQQHNIRAGAYRLSRVPKELVGTRDDLISSLKPTWKVGS